MGLLEDIKNAEAGMDRIIEKSIRIKRTWEEINMAAKNYDELVTKLEGATTTIGERMKKLLAEIKDGGLTAEQEAANLAKLDALTDKLVDMGKDPVEPVPPVEPVA